MLPPKEQHQHTSDNSDDRDYPAPPAVADSGLELPDIPEINRVDLLKASFTPMPQTREPAPLQAEDDDFIVPTPHVTISLSPDKMEAYLTIEQDPPLPYKTTPADVRLALTQARVEFGLMQEKIAAIVANRQYPQLELIAQGQPMQPGVDGRLDYLVSLTAGGRPKDLGYRVDHHNLNLVQNVKAGDVLVRKTPPVPGKEGMTVQGRLLRPPKVRDPRLPVGKGAKISAANPLELVAEKNGFVRLDRRTFDQMVVDQVFQIHGNVDLSTGNLDVEGAIHINRNVTEGLSVKATGDITIHGLVESCRLEAGGHIYIRGGVIGGVQRATIKAAGDVAIKFADQADITAGSNVYIADEAINCVIRAEELVIIGGEGGKMMGAIIGGRVSAGQEIRTISAGTDTGIHTRLRVGERPSLLQRRRAMEAEIRQLENRLDQLDTQIAGLSAKLAERGPARETSAAQVAVLEARQAQLYHQMKGFLAQAQEAGLLAAPDETIEITETEIETTTHTLSRIEAHLAAIMVKQRVAPLTPEEQDTYAKLIQARQNLNQKLADIQALLAGQKSRWNRTARALWRDLEVSRAGLEDVRARLERLRNEDVFNQKIEHTIPHLEAERDIFKNNLDQLLDELEILKEEIAAASQRLPKITVAGKIWPGVEVMIFNHQHRFNKVEQAVSIQLAADDESGIVVRNIGGMLR